MARWLMAAVSVVLVCVPRAASAQIEVDRTLSRVGSAVITASDVDLARRVKLVKDISSDAATLRALEDRLLILQEASRGAPPDVSDAAVAARRRELADDRQRPALRRARRLRGAVPRVLRHRPPRHADRDQGPPQVLEAHP